jgi:hypothetical protein
VTNKTPTPIRTLYDDGSRDDLIKLQIESERKYKTRWNVYHTILCLGVWGILACTVWAVFVGWK